MVSSPDTASSPQKTSWAMLPKASKVRDSLEYYSALRTDRAVHTSDVCVVMVDASTAGQTRRTPVTAASSRFKPLRRSHSMLSSTTIVLSFWPEASRAEKFL